MGQGRKQRRDEVWTQPKRLPLPWDGASLPLGSVSRAGQGLVSRLCPRLCGLHRAGNQEDGVFSRVILPGNRGETLQSPSRALSSSPRAAPLPCPSSAIQQFLRDKCDLLKCTVTSGISLSTGFTAGKSPLQEAELIFLSVEQCSSPDSNSSHTPALTKFLSIPHYCCGCWRGARENTVLWEAAEGDWTPSPHLL